MLFTDLNNENMDPIGSSFKIAENYLTRSESILQPIQTTTNTKSNPVINPFVVPKASQQQVISPAQQQVISPAQQQVISPTSHFGQDINHMVPNKLGNQQIRYSIYEIPDLHGFFAIKVNKGTIYFLFLQNQKKSLDWISKDHCLRPFL